MQVDDAGEDHGQQLPHRHDDDEDDRTELGDGVVDEELAAGGAQRQDDTVAHKPTSGVRLNSGSQKELSIRLVAVWRI